MRYYFLIIFAFLLLILPVTAYTVPQIQTVYGCSADQASSLPQWGQLSLTSTPSGAHVYLDNDNWMDATVYMGCSSLFGQTTCYPKPVSNTPASGNVSPGKHTIRVSMSGYNDETVTVNICSQKVTYATVNLAAIPTTVPTTAAPVRGGMITFAQATTTPVPGTTTLPISVPATTVTSVQGSTTQMTLQEASQQAVTQAAGTAPALPDTLGSLSVTTTPAGAFIFIDGVQRGVSPATIPGLSTGTHTVLLKLDGYQDLSTPVTIAAGKTQDYVTSMAKNGADAPAATETANTTASSKKAPGFEFALILMAMGAVLGMRRVS